MKNVFKIFLILLLFITIGTQKSFSQLKFGVKGGVNLANIAQDYKDASDEEATKMSVLYTFGGVIDFSLSDAMSIQSGLLLSAKGYSVDVKEEYDATGFDRYVINYLEIPVSFAYKIKGFQVYAGPYVAFGIFGKNKWDLKGDGWDDSGDAKFKFVMKEVDLESLADDELPAKRVDYGLNFGVGYQLGPILINAGYSLGLANLTPAIKDFDEFDPKDNKNSTRTISLTATFFFGK